MLNIETDNKIYAAVYKLLSVALPRTEENKIIKYCDQHCGRSES